jgi:hypothetical protein
MPVSKARRIVLVHVLALNDDLRQLDDCIAVCAYVIQVSRAGIGLHGHDRILHSGSFCARSGISRDAGYCAGIGRHLLGHGMTGVVSLHSLVVRESVCCWTSA